MCLSYAGDGSGAAARWSAWGTQTATQAAQFTQSTGRASHGPCGVRPRHWVGQTVTHAPHAVQRSSLRVSRGSVTGHPAEEERPGGDPGGVDEYVADVAVAAGHVGLADLRGDAVDHQ